MGKQVKETYNIDTLTVYPPVNDDFLEIPWDECEEGFVCMGTVSPGKHVEDMILIIEKVRQEGFPVHFHIIGSCSDPVYAKKIKRLCEENHEWLFWEGRLSRKQLTYLVAKHKYGIHGMPNEHFGIAVAEMVKAGCVPFVPNSGGQVEIVQDRRLIYEDTEDAVYKIINILNNEVIQKDIRKNLLKRSAQFSTKVFMESIRTIVEQAFA
jgi:glycosyltransferase involved in cell wall biosynthesis